MLVRSAREYSKLLGKLIAELNRFASKPGFESRGIGFEQVDTHTVGLHPVMQELGLAWQSLIWPFAIVC